VIPWQLDFTALEEAVFIRAVAQPAGRRNLTIDGCRVLARQFRERVEARQVRAAALVGRSHACPFDLRRPLPVPAAILQLGPTHPDTRMWLAAHWGITDRLRLPNTARRSREVARNTIVTAVAPNFPLTVFTTPTTVQQRAFELLGVVLQPGGRLHNDEVPSGRDPR
jgi:hypothetical protein